MPGRQGGHNHGEHLAVLCGLQTTASNPCCATRASAVEQLPANAPEKGAVERVRKCGIPGVSGETKFMHKSYIIRMGTKLVELRPVKMNFACLLEELEYAEAQCRQPRLRVGSVRKVTPAVFAEFCRRHGLIETGGWDGFCVFTKPDFLWPPRHAMHQPRALLRYAQKAETQK